MDLANVFNKSPLLWGATRPQTPRCFQVLDFIYPDASRVICGSYLLDETKPST